MKNALLIALASVLLLAAGLGMAGCSGLDPAGNKTAAEDIAAFPQPDDGEFSVMSFNLHHYALRDGDGDAPPAPRPEAAALIEVVRLVSPDVLAVQEMGDPAAWADFKYRLRQAGLDYRYEDYLRHDPQDLNLAVLSRYPIVARQSHTDDTYTIGPGQFPILRGILDVDIEINPGYRFRLMAVHLKSKVFHEYGQAEMRRNEARLLGNHVRAALNENPQVNLLVVGDFNDVPDSRPLREIHTYQDRPLLFDLRPTDDVGDAWTRRDIGDGHARTDYLLASSGLLNEVQLGKTYLVRSPLLQLATDHRPLVATFVAEERSAEAAPDLSVRRPPEFPQND